MKEIYEDGVIALKKEGIDPSEICKRLSIDLWAYNDAIERYRGDDVFGQPIFETPEVYYEKLRFLDIIYNRMQQLEKLFGRADAFYLNAEREAKINLFNNVYSKLTNSTLFTAEDDSQYLFSRADTGENVNDPPRN